MTFQMVLHLTLTDLHTVYFNWVVLTASCWSQSMGHTDDTQLIMPLKHKCCDTLTSIVSVLLAIILLCVHVWTDIKLLYFYSIIRKNDFEVKREKSNSRERSGSKYVTLNPRSHYIYVDINSVKSYLSCLKNN